MTTPPPDVIIPEIDPPPRRRRRRPRPRAWRAPVHFGLNAVFCIAVIIAAFLAISAIWFQ